MCIAFIRIEKDRTVLKYFICVSKNKKAFVRRLPANKISVISKCMSVKLFSFFYVTSVCLKNGLLIR